MDNIGTGWDFPVRVDTAGHAKVRSSEQGPYDFSAYPAGAYLWLYVNENVKQTFHIPQGTWSAQMIAQQFLADIRGAKASASDGYLEIWSEEDNPDKSYIIVDAPLVAGAIDSLHLPRGTVKGFGKGNIAWSRNPDQSLVTPEETKNELSKALWVLLLTGKGEMPMIRSYGVGLQDFVGKMNGPHLESLLKHRIITETLEWDPRIAPDSISTFSKDNVLYLRIGYVAKETQIEGQLTIPIKEL